MRASRTSAFSVCFGGRDAEPVKRTLDRFGTEGGRALRRRSGRQESDALQAALLGVQRTAFAMLGLSALQGAARRAALRARPLLNEMTVRAHAMGHADGGSEPLGDGA